MPIARASAGGLVTSREGELDSRLRDRDRTIEDSNLRLRELTLLLRKEQAARESLTRRLTTPDPLLLARVPRALRREAVKKAL
jgi:hypothetical protein